MNMAWEFKQDYGADGYISFRWKNKDLIYISSKSGFALTSRLRTDPFPLLAPILKSTRCYPLPEVVIGADGAKPVRSRQDHLKFASKANCRSDNLGCDGVYGSS